MARRPQTDEERRHGRVLGSLLSQVRGHRGLTTQQVAGQANLSVDTVRSLESGRVAAPSFLTVARLTDVLEISLDQLHRDAQEST